MILMNQARLSRLGVPHAVTVIKQLLDADDFCRALHDSAPLGKRERRSVAARLQNIQSSQNKFYQTNKYFFHKKYSNN
jgi:hypothetical protein